jgi:tetratricopeptide (TPR) repeat protein
MPTRPRRDRKKSAAAPPRPDPARRVAADQPALATFLLRPFVDLATSEGPAPIYARSLEHYWNAFADPRLPRFALQRALPRRFRAQFLAEARLTDYDVQDPRELALPLRSERWRALCDAIDAWPRQKAAERCRLVLLLHALCLYRFIADIVPERGDSVRLDCADGAELAYWRASACYVLGRPDRIGEYEHADLAAFAAIAEHAPRDAPATLNAALKLLVHKAKIGAPATALATALAHVEPILAPVTAAADPFTHGLFLSRFYRAAAFVPQRRGDRAETVRLMDLAEAHALALAPKDDSEALAERENRHALFESRTKEALWLGDLDLALARAQHLVEIDPYDSKIWLELGQVRRRRDEPTLAAEAYLVAATLGAPATAIARHMAGLCFREAGLPAVAAYFFRAAIDADPGAIAPHDEIQTLPDLPGFAALKAWSLAAFTI